jgi:hypothetical protein
MAKTILIFRIIIKTGQFIIHKFQIQIIRVITWAMAQICQS